MSQSIQPQKTYRYYVGYMTTDTGEVGGLNVTRRMPISSQDDVLVVQRMMRDSEPALRNAVVTAFSLYANEA